MKKEFKIAAVIVGFIGIVSVMILSINQIATANPKPTEDWQFSEVRAFEKELQNPTLSDEDRKFLEAKIQALSQSLYYQQTLKAKGAQQLTEMPTQVVAARETAAHTTPVIEEKRLIGIIDNPSVAFPRSDFEINNAWQELINGEYIIVYAGSLVKEPSQGILIVYSEADHTFKFISPQNKNGSLRILEVKGYRLIIQQANINSRLYFDVPAMSFATSLDGELVPTTTTEVLNPEQTPTSPYPPP